MTDAAILHRQDLARDNAPLCSGIDSEHWAGNVTCVACNPDRALPDGYREIVASLRAEVVTLRRSNVEYERVVETLAEKLIKMQEARNSWRDSCLEAEEKARTLLAEKQRGLWREPGETRD
jgi:hypothetical protein